jgi:hypothetical protein
LIPKPQSVNIQKKEYDMWITSGRGDLINSDYIVAFGIKCIVPEDDPVYYVRAYTTSEAYWNMDGPFYTQEEAQRSLNNLAANIMESQLE